MSSPQSTRSAAAILDAWLRLDQAALEAALEHALALPGNPSPTTLEAERRELLESIAGCLQPRTGNGAGGRLSPPETCLTLLRHLARSRF